MALKNLFKPETGSSSTMGEVKPADSCTALAISANIDSPEIEKEKFCETDTETRKNNLKTRKT